MSSRFSTSMIFHLMIELISTFHCLWIVKVKRRANAWLGVSLCVIKCSFQEMMCIRRSFKKKLLHFFLPFEL
jgi:hypothetical protein